MDKNGRSVGPDYDERFTTSSLNRAAWKDLLESAAVGAAPTSISPLR
jgi:hypothetical protein